MHLDLDLDGPCSGVIVDGLHAYYFPLCYIYCKYSFRGHKQTRKLNACDVCKNLHTVDNGSKRDQRHENRFYWTSPSLYVIIIVSVPDDS
jgi:hypothetical protein